MNSLDVESRDFGWLVGILEGEGSFGFVTNKGHKYATIRMMSTDEDVVSRIRTLTGIGSFMGPYTRSAIHKPIWRWEVSNRGAVELMNLLLPYMSERRKQRIVEVLKIEAEERVRGRLGYVINGTRNLQKARESKTQSGQVTVFAALMLIVFVSVAAFCLNAAYAFHQHTQMQAQIDTTTLYASGTGCDASLLTLPTGLAIGTPVAGGPYAGNNKYCEGVYQKDAGSLFGKILKFPFRISVHAVALKGGSTEPHFSILGLSTVGQPNGTNIGCSVSFGGSETLTVTGNVYANSTGTNCNNGGSGPVYTAGSALYNAPPTYPDPFRISVPTSGPAAVAGSNNCGISVRSGETAYRPSDNTGIAVVPTMGGSSKAAFLPYCSGGVTYPGIYLITGNFDPDTIDVISSTLILEYSGSLGNGGGNLNGGSWTFVSPSTGILKGYSFYQETACTTDSQTSLNLNGGFAISVDGLFDVSCMALSANGGAGQLFNGPLIAQTIAFGGGSGSVTFNPPTSDPARGSFLVQ